MVLGKKSLAKRAPKEVVYYDPHHIKKKVRYGPEKGMVVSRPYYVPFELYESFGGWVSSIEELILFIMAFEDLSKCPLLSQGTTEKMLSPWPGETKRKFRGLGWRVKPQGENSSFWHGGTAGGSALVMRRHDGIMWAVVFNADRNKEGEKLSAMIGSVLWRAADAFIE